MKMIKFIFLLIILFGFNYLAYTQVSNTLLRPANEVVIIQDSAKLMASCKTDYLKGLKFTFNGKIKNIQIDTTYENIVAFLKYKNSEGYKEIVSYKYLCDSIIWKYRSLSKNCIFIDDYVILIYRDTYTGNYSKLFILNRKTGSPRYVIENITLFPIPEKEIFLSFPLFGLNKQVEIIDMKTFQILGRSEIQGDYFFSHYAIEDSILFLNINGIYAFDRHYKILWQTKLYTMEFSLDISSILPTSIIGLGLGILTGYFPVFLPTNYSTFLNSDFIFNDENIIVSDKYKIFSYNKYDGTEKWSNKLPDKTAYSHIINLRDSLLILFNTALCYRNGRANKFGKPYYASYNINNGQGKKYYTINESDYIVDFIEKSSLTTLLLNNQIIKLRNDEIIAKKVFNLNDTIGDFNAFYDSTEIKLNFYDIKEHTWCNPESLKETDNELIVISLKGLVIINQDYEISNFIPIDRIGIIRLENQNFRFLETFIERKGHIKFNGLVKYNKLNHKRIIYKLNNPYLIDKTRLFSIEKNSITIYNLE
jgi:hypothetical protein